MSKIERMRRRLKSSLGDDKRSVRIELSLDDRRARAALIKLRRFLTSVNKAIDAYLK